MIKKIKINKYSVLLIVILVAATFLRFVGTKPGYHPNHSDETTIYSTALDFIKHNNFKPYRYEYPALTNLINYFFDKYFFIPLGWLKFLTLNFNKILDGQIKFPLGKDIYDKVFQLQILGAQDVNILFWSRWVTALFGVGVVWASYLVGKKLFGKSTGLISAFLVGINYRQVLNSHFGLPDIYNAFFFLLSFWTILHLREKVNIWRSLLCGIVLGLYLSTKCQFFPFIALFLVYIEKSWQKENLKAKIAFLFNRYFLMIPLVSLLVFLLLNPYLFINLETALSQLAYASLKYGVGSMKLLLYSYSYLFKIGIGKVTSFVLIFGIFLSLVKDRWKSILLLSMIVPYFYFFTFYTSGGFYTRNFVSVIPLLLIYAAYAIYQLASFKPRIIFILLTLAIFSLASFENLKNSTTVVSAYTQPWNRVIINDWIVNNIPEGKKIAAHSSVPLPDYIYERLPYDMYPAFSLDEFQEMGADYAITSFDWATVDFYGWMRETNTIKFWNKPIAILEQTFPAMAVEEMTSYVTYSIINPWQAPDLDFMVVKVPFYSVIEKKIEKTYKFENGPEGWTKEGSLWYGDTQLEWKDRSLAINEGGSASQILHWESEPIDVMGWNSFEIDYEIKTDAISTERRDGFIFVAAYGSFEDAKSDKNRISIRLGARNNIFNHWVEKSLIGNLSTKAKFIRIGLQAYNSVIGMVSLRNVEVYNAKVKVSNIEGTKHIDLDENIAFPVSHGNL